MPEPPPQISLYPFSTKNIYAHMAKKARKEIWKQISKWAMRQELEQKVKKPRVLKEGGKVKLGVGEMACFYPQQPEGISWVEPFCVCVWVCKDKHWKKLYRVARNLSRFKRNKTQKSLLLHTLVCARASLEESSYSLWDFHPPTFSHFGFHLC